MFSIEICIIFAGAVVLSMLTAIGTRAIALKYKIVNDPNPIVPQHKEPVAYLGGLGIIVGVVFTLLIISLFRQEYLYSVLLDSGLAWSIIIPGILFLIVGTADDLRKFSPALKFGLQVLGAIVAVLLGLIYPLTNNYILDGILSALWIITIVNAVNLTDVCDGLVTGLAIIMFVFFSYFQRESSLFTVILAGACTGFLFFNRPKATIFLGDGGSNCIGFLVAALVIKGGSHMPPWPYIPIMVFILGVPIFELIFVTLVRIKKGLPWWLGSPDHFSLRLQEAGFSTIQTDMIAWGAAIVLGLVAILFAGTILLLQIMIAIIICIVMVLSGSVLLRWEVRSL